MSSREEDRMGKMRGGAVLAALAMLSAFAAYAAPKGLGPLETVAELDPQRYMGRWYEIARFQQSFERDLVGVTAEYALKKDGTVSVLNSGFKGSLEGKYKAAKGVARIPDPARPSRLKVSFFWPFAGDYLVFGLDGKDYSWALVGDDSRKYLWFLSRSPSIAPELLASMRSMAEAQGYDLAGLYEVPQKAR
jgi:apolipoprotein D and lipocalin family protein